ncbi:hypothetical protein [Oceanobacillus senegalensis]|uniref:hypothetical protein n=1 Tax=Oceanobacillus senegalensis TaxID=1936063 RepID=UPI000A30B8BB|nr:hypothetical protein [Oceanobacillus senegalensis]
MSSYDEFIDEKRLIDELMQDNYWIKNIKGTLEGDLVEFEKIDGSASHRTIRLTNPDSRKYITTLVMKGKLQKHKKLFI